MKVTTLVIQVSLILTAVSLIIMGLAINEMNIYEVANNARSVGLKAWRELLAPYISGLTEPGQ